MIASPFKHWDNSKCCCHFPDDRECFRSRHHIYSSEEDESESEREDQDCECVCHENYRCARWRMPENMGKCTHEP